MTAGNSPIRTSVTENKAGAAAIAMSCAEISPSAPANAEPWMRAIVGFDRRSIVFRSAASRPASARFSASV